MSFGACLLIMKTICFDIEATDGDEILELSIYDVDGCKEIYHSYFKPVRSREWPNSQTVHHITPQMVADAPTFSRERDVVRGVLDEADAIVGFAIDNDLKYMRANGVEVPANVAVVDARIWYGLVYGKEQGIEFNAVPRLAVCANALGIPFSEQAEAHSASNDTRVTVEIFRRMLAYCGAGALSAELIASMNCRYEREREGFMRIHAHGYISLVRRGAGYMLKNNHAFPERYDHVIEVESRFAAESDLRNRFEQRRMPGDPAVYRLSDRDLRYFKAYSNAYDADREARCKDFLSRKKGREVNLAFRF